MGVIKSRGATRKLGPLSLGRVVRIKPQNVNRRFIIHEDVLCATSKLFKTRLQQHRKAVEGECPVCSDAIDPALADVTFCRSECGQNLHSHCLAEREHSVPGQLTCPMCRGDWTDNASAEALNLPSRGDLGPRAIQTYVDWLYTKSIHVDPNISPDTDEYNAFLLKAWTVADAFQDKSCKHAIVALLGFLLAKSSNPGFRSASLEYVFGTATSSDMRHFATRARYVFSTARGSGLDDVFLSEGVQKNINKYKRSFQKGLIRQFTDDEYTLEDDESGGVTV